MKKKKKKQFRKSKCLQFNIITWDWVVPGPEINRIYITYHCMLLVCHQMFQSVNISLLSHRQGYILCHIYRCNYLQILEGYLDMTLRLCYQPVDICIGELNKKSLES